MKLGVCSVKGFCPVSSSYCRESSSDSANPAKQCEFYLEILLFSLAKKHTFLKKLVLKVQPQAMLQPCLPSPHSQELQEAEFCMVFIRQKDEASFFYSSLLLVFDKDRGSSACLAFGFIPLEINN